MTYNDHYKNNRNQREKEKIGDDFYAVPHQNQKSKKNRSRTLVDETYRTSTFYYFGKLHDARIAALEQRIVTLLGCWVHQIEPL
jgi:hypothetical protein